MLIQITNTCNELCPHCLQCSSTEAQHMDMKTARKAHDLAKRLGVHVVSITGGEPTLHPQFREMVELFSDMPVVSILSNGTFISDEKKTYTMKKLLGRKNAFLQVTSVPEYYKDYEYIETKSIKIIQKYYRKRIECS